MDDAPVCPVFNHGMEGVRFDKHVEHIERDTYRALRIERPARHEFREIFTLDVFHRDVEIPIAIAYVEDLRYPSAGFALRQLVLQRGPASFRGHDIVTVAIAAGVDQLQSDLAVQHGVVSQEHPSHTATGQFTNDLISAEELGVHIYPRPALMDMRLPAAFVRARTRRSW